MDCLLSEEYGCIIYLVFWTVILSLIAFAILYWVATRCGEPLVIYSYHHIVDLHHRSLQEKMTFDEAGNTLEKIKDIRRWLFIIVSRASREEVEETLDEMESYCREIFFPVKEKNR